MLVDLARPETTPNFDVYSDIVYASNGYVVDTVISMGEVLMEADTSKVRKRSSRMPGRLQSD